jgi:prepilin peptidase CpaA
MLEAAILVVFPFAMAHAAISDMLSMTIANRVSLLLIGSFAILAPLTGMPLYALGMHAVAMIVVLAVCFGFFAMGVMGGGDAKLLASTALWFGFSPELMNYLLLASILGGALTLAILNYRGSSMAVLTGRVGFLARIADAKEKIPYGIALGAAGLIVFPDTEMAQWVMQRLAS